MGRHGQQPSVRNCPNAHSETGAELGARGVRESHCEEREEEVGEPEQYD